MQGNQLNLERCPHCGIAKPHLDRKWQNKSHNSEGRNATAWSVYRCNTCGKMTMVYSEHDANSTIQGMWPTSIEVAEELPPRARDFLSQAISSLNAPAGAVMLTASAVDAMLKTKGYKAGTLNARIDQAARDHLITSEMAAWAHEIRLDANDQRHADEDSALPSHDDATKVVKFAMALAQFLFVLPARVERGRKE